MSMSQVVETELSTTGPVADRLTIWPMDDGRWTLRFGPLTATEIDIALRAFVY